jgi:hypothetical protein
MNGRRRPRRPRWTPAVNTLAIAASRASKLSHEQLEGILQPLHEAHKALREGVATRTQWAIAASAVEVALGIEKQGVVRGLREHLKTAEQCLHAVQLRALATGSWKAPTHYFYELESIAEAVRLHTYQLEQLSEGEVRTVIRRAVAEISSAGGEIIHLSREVHA